MDKEDNPRELGPWDRFSITIRRNKLKKWDDKRLAEKSNPEGKTLSRSEWIRDRVDDSMEKEDPYDIRLLRKIRRLMRGGE